MHLCSIINIRGWVGVLRKPSKATDTEYFLAYHIFISTSLTNCDFTFDCYLGSARSVDFYWESIGRKLSLPIIASLTERADSEQGLSIFSNELIIFRNELEVFELYWIEKSITMDLPERFLQKIREIILATNAAVLNGLVLTVA